MDSLVVIMFIVVIVIGIGLLAIITLTRKKPPGIDQQTFRSNWLKIENNLKDDEASRHLAILNADKLLDTALKARGFKGATMGERLKSARNSFKNNNAIWAAHKLRNKIAHESDIQIKAQTAKYALGAFKAGLKDLGAL